MNDAIERQNRRQMRGTILRALETCYGRGAGNDGLLATTIGHVVNPLWPRREAERKLLPELQLLIDSGYVERREARRDALDDDPPVAYRLTGRGARLLNGELADDAVEL